MTANATQFLATYLPPEFALLRNGFSAIPMPAEDTPIAGHGYHTGAGKTLEAGSRGRRVGRKVYCLTPQPLPPEPLEPKWPTETKIKGKFASNPQSWMLGIISLKKCVWPQNMFSGLQTILESSDSVQNEFGLYTCTSYV